MDTTISFPLPWKRDDATLAAISEQLAMAGLSVTREDVRMLMERRAEALAEVERVEFGVPAMATIAEAIAQSPFLSRDSVTDVIAELQDAFYALRDELPTDVPDVEIVEALRGCFDAREGDVAEIAALSKEEMMAFSNEYARATAAVECDEYRIIDDEGRVYAFNSAEWDYDETADGWEGERWSDDFGD